MTIKSQQDALKEATDWLAEKFEGKGVEIKVIDWNKNYRYNYPPSRLLKEYAMRHQEAPLKEDAIQNTEKIFTKKLVKMDAQTIEEAGQKYLSKVADGKRVTGYADEDFRMGALWQQQRSYTEEEMKLFARSYFREIKLDTTNTLWSDLADRCFEQFKKK